MTRHRSDRRDLIVETIDDFTAEYGHPPSIRDIMPRVGLSSTSAVHFHVDRLIKAGRVRYCACGCRRVFVVDLSGPGVAYITGQDSPADVERKMAEVFAPVDALLAAFGRYMDDDS